MVLPAVLSLLLLLMLVFGTKPCSWGGLRSAVGVRALSAVILHEYILHGLLEEVREEDAVLVCGVESTRSCCTCTCVAQGTPTHMSPELFMSGRVSKACDSFAFGTLLYELVTGQRAFTGVPLPLLPHEVAVKGLRPEWPAGLPAAFWPLQQLAEACWAQDPETRCVHCAVVEPAHVREQSAGTDRQLSELPACTICSQPTGVQDGCLELMWMCARQGLLQDLTCVLWPFPPCRPVFTQIIEAVDAWVGGDASFRPLWQKAVPPGAQQQGPSPLTHSPLAEGQPVLSPAPQLHPQIQQQQHRQWRHTVLHADEKAESPVARNGNLADVHAAAAVARAGQLDWSEVSFEKAHKPAQPN